MAIFLHDEFGLVEEIARAKGWVTVRDEGGVEHKVRPTALADVPFTDEVGDFPRGICPHGR